MMTSAGREDRRFVLPESAPGARQAGFYVHQAWWRTARTALYRAEIPL